MFTLVRRFIKTGIVFLFLGLMLGFFILVRREIYGRHADPHLTSAHTHAVAIGFVLFLILGVALWLFPRAPKDDTRYSPARIEFAYWLLAGSTALRFMSELGRAFTDSSVLAWLVVATAVGQMTALATYFWTMWPRIRSVGSHVREQAGERF